MKKEDNLPRGVLGSDMVKFYGYDPDKVEIRIGGFGETKDETKE